LAFDESDIICVEAITSPLAEFAAAFIPQRNALAFAVFMRFTLVKEASAMPANYCRAKNGWYYQIDKGEFVAVIKQKAVMPPFVTQEALS
jgi:hypothetical protein